MIRNEETDAQICERAMQGSEGAMVAYALLVIADVLESFLEVEEEDDVH